jgi:hypothetical protein
VRRFRRAWLKSGQEENLLERNDAINYLISLGEEKKGSSSGVVSREMR